jgi:hypothetical protein
MKHPILAILVALLAFPAASRAMERPSFHTEGPLKPGEYWWAPRISPDGPVVVLISLPQQVMNVYRNGVIVARSSISSGMQGHSTPTGVFTILEKSVNHYSKTYDNAPMPYMERLTWDGVAFHSGYLPGHAASHGCIRLPYEFSKKLFELTQKGGTVVIGDQHSLSTSYAADPGLVLPVLKSTTPTGGGIPSAAPAVRSPSSSARRTAPSTSTATASASDVPASGSRGWASSETMSSPGSPRPVTPPQATAG